MSLDSNQTKYPAAEHLVLQRSAHPVSSNEHRLPLETKEEAAKGKGL